MHPLRRSLAERLVAWIVTGPLGHLWSVVADVAVLLARYGRSRFRERYAARRGAP